MVQRGEHFGFALEAGQPVGVSSERFWQHLERHVAVELGVPGLIDLSHAALTDEGTHGIRSDCRAFA